MEFEIWFKCFCPKCKKANWIYVGYEPDPDLSKHDVDGFLCWNCKREVWLSDEPEFQENMGYGKEKPK